MRYDAQNRIMSLSFERDPNEHADVMLETTKRFMTPPAPAHRRNILIGSLAFGAMVGLAMEIYRRFVLPPLLGVSEVTPLNIIILQLLPFLLLLAALIFGLSRSGNRRQRQTLIDRLGKKTFVDTDIYPEGIRSMAGTVYIQIDWTAIRTISVSDKRIEFEGETIVLYLPYRAFESRADYVLRAKELRTIWQNAKLKIESETGETLAGEVA